MATGFPTKTNFTAGNALSASDLNDVSGTLSSLVSTGTYPNQLSFPSAADAVRRPLPFATQAGSNSSTLTSAATWSYGSFSVTFAASRFTQAPIVTVSAVSLSSTIFTGASITAPTTSGFTMRIFHGGASAGTVTAHWQAVQMTSAAAAG